MLTYRKPKWWAVVLAAVLCVTAAGCMLTDPATGPESDPARYELPGLKWGMSPDEVLSAFDQTRADIVHENESEDSDERYWRYVMILHGVEAFGQETTAAMFSFVDYTQNGMSYQLNEVKLCYPDGYDGLDKADIAALEGELNQIYGEPNESKHWDWETCKDMEVTQELPANLFSWESSVTGWDCLTEEQQKAVRDDYEANRTEDSISLERYLGYWKVPAFRMSFQPYWQRFLALGNHALTDENRNLGITNICIAMDAVTYFGFQDSAEDVMETE